MAEKSHVGTGGLFDSLKMLSSNLVGIVRTRFELLSTDIAEAREHLVLLLTAALVALFCLGVGIVLLAILIAVAFWESHRLMALGGLTGIFLAAGAGAVWLAMHKARTRPRLFEASLAELSQDRQRLTARS